MRIRLLNNWQKNLASSKKEGDFMKKLLHSIKIYRSTWLALAVTVALLNLLLAVFAFPRFAAILLNVLAAIFSIAVIIQGARDAVRVQAKIQAAHNLANLANSRTPEEQMKAALGAPPPSPDYFSRERNVNPPKEIGK
jgi:hypothetical protein